MDIKRILRQTPELIKKTFFIQHDGVDVVTEARVKRFGQISKLGTNGFAELAVDGGFLTPRSRPQLSIGRSVVEFVPPSGFRVPTDREFLDLIMIGEYNHALGLHDSNARNLYVCERDVVRTVVDKIDSGGIRAVVLHGEIANGKSVTTALIGGAAAARGWRVFMTTQLSEHAGRELRQTAELDGKNLLIVDNYVDWLHQLKGIRDVASDRFTILATARSNAHDLASDDLAESLSTGSIEEHNLNALSPTELEWWVQTLNSYGLWGDLAAASPHEKIRCLADKCGRSIQGILLRIFESPSVKERLSNAAKEIKSNPLVEKIAVTIFALTVLNQGPRLRTIEDIWGVDALDRDVVKANHGLANFIDLSNATVRVRSAAAAEYLLTNHWQAHEVVPILLEIAHAADRFYHISIIYENIFKVMMRFGQIQFVLPEAGKREAVISYYENLKLIPRCASSPLFWLQYAIGALVIGDLLRAEKYFDTSYSLALQRQWDTYQIDNHYARFLLVRATEEAPFEEAMDLFRKARSLINRQINNERLHYPFRVAATYQAFFDRFRSRFSEDQLREVSQAADTVANRISVLPGERSRHKHVRNCADAMRYIIDSAEQQLERN